VTVDVVWYRHSLLLTSGCKSIGWVQKLFIACMQTTLSELIDPQSLLHHTVGRHSHSTVWACCWSPIQVHVQQPNVRWTGVTARLHLPVNRIICPLNCSISNRSTVGNLFGLMDIRGPQRSGSSKGSFLQCGCCCNRHSGSSVPRLDIRQWSWARRTPYCRSIMALLTGPGLYTRTEGVWQRQSMEIRWHLIPFTDGAWGKREFLKICTLHSSLLGGLHSITVPATTDCRRFCCFVFLFFSFFLSF